LAARFADDDAFDHGQTSELFAEPFSDSIETPSIAPDSGGLSILVAEDNEINALLARALLEKLGHRTVVVESGGAAVARWEGARGRRRFCRQAARSRAPRRGARRIGRARFRRVRVTTFAARLLRSDGFRSFS